MIPSRIRQWMPLIQASCDRHGIGGYSLVLAGHMDAESLGGYALEPTGPAGRGDHTRALGLMQIDERFHPEFAARVAANGLPAWQDPASNIDYAARLWAENFAHFTKRIDKRALYRGEPLDMCILVLTVAAYNAGAERVARAYDEPTKPTTYEQVLQLADACTTHRTRGDSRVGYVSTVLDAVDRFQVPEHSPSKPPPPKPKE
jgi:hypothetical protein